MRTSIIRILVACGTRPEIIKLGPVCQALKRAGAELEVFWSGQHVELAAGLHELFDVPFTSNGSDVVQEPSLAGKFGLMTRQIGNLLGSGNYDWIVVQGDTTTSAAAATAGFFARVPVAHVEAGLRTGDLQSPWPEEFNRRLVGLASALHFAPTERARSNLLREGVPTDQVVVVGNTAVDALLYTRKWMGEDYVPIDEDVAALPLDKKLVLVTLHRRENIGDPLCNVMQALRTLGNDGDKLIVLPVHMNPQVRAEVFKMLAGAPNVRLLKPLQYTDFVYLLNRAWTVVTDSGGIQEEAPTFGLQILIARETTERPEVIEAGFGTLVGSDCRAIVSGVRKLTATDHRQLLPARNPFGRGDASEQIAAHLMNRVCNRRLQLGAA